LTRRKSYLLVFTLMIVAGSAVLLSACNTTEGVGEDMSAAGGALSRSADDNKSY